MSDVIDHIGPYEIIGELGRGAMARVWLGRDPKLDREVAIKEPLFDPRLEDHVLAEMRRRFVREAKTAANLNHPGIVTIYAADDYDGRTAIVMELVDGATLADILKQGPLEPAAALDALDQLLDAVGYAHANSVVHRDIKPENIFVTNDGRVKLADFGIARVGSGLGTTATVEGAVLGTPGYMSPEQVKGKLVDSRSDLFSIGVVGYEMLTGFNPFGAGSDTDLTTIMYRIVHEDVPELPESLAAELAVDFRPAIMSALAKYPENRPQSAADFKAMLHGECDAPTARLAAPAGGTGSPSYQTAELPNAQGSRIPKWLPFAIVAGVCIVVLLVVLFNAMSGSRGGGASPSPSTTSSVATAETYLAINDGKVALYKSDSATPIETFNLELDYLDANTKTELENHKRYSSQEEARAEVEKLRAAVEAAKKKEQAEREAAEQAAREQAEREAAEQAAREQAEREATARAAQEAAERAAQDQPFWGVWIGAFREYDNAVNFTAGAREKGFDAQMLVSSDWTNLNSNHFYVVTVGKFQSQDAANELLPRAQEAGYSDAYVKFSGDRK